jgi:hypothetical protein
MQTVDLKITRPDQLAREAGKTLLVAMQRLRDADGPPLTEDDIAAEVAAVRLNRADQRPPATGVGTNINPTAPCARRFSV